MGRARFISRKLRKTDEFDILFYVLFDILFEIVFEVLDFI
jgi:hypothetical protein